MKKLFSLLLIISMISTGAIATFAETVNEDVVISDVVEDIEINEEEVSEEVAEEDFAVDVANEDVEATEVVEDVAEVDEEKSEAEEVTEAEASDDSKDEEIGEIVLVPMKEDSSNNETTEVEEDETEAEEELLGASNNVTVTIKIVNNIPFDGKTKDFKITVKKGSSLDDDPLFPNRQVNGLREPDIKKYNFPWLKSEVNGGDYYYQQIGWKIGNKEIKKEEKLSAPLPLETNFSKYKINSNITMSPIWRRTSSIEISANGGEIYNKKLKRNTRGSISFRVMENQVLQNVVEDDLGDIKREGYYFKGWKSVRYNKVYNSLKDYKSQGYIDHVSAQWEEIDKGPFISDLVVASADKKDTAVKQITDRGYKVIDFDLNRSVGGKYIYLGYRTTTDRSKAIKDIVVMYQKGAPSSINYGKVVDGKRPTYYKVSNIDLNQKAGGDYIYLYYTKDSKAGNAMKEISFFLDETYYTFENNKCYAHYPYKRTAQTYRNLYFNGDNSVQIVPVVNNNSTTGIKAANLNSGSRVDKKVKNGKKTYNMKYENWLGIGIRRSKN